MLKVLKKIVSIIFNPIGSTKTDKASNDVTEFFVKYPVFLVVIAVLITALVFAFCWFTKIFVIA